MGQNEISENRNHKWIGAALEEAVDPELESAAESELCAKDFVLAENEKKGADGDTKSSQNLGIPISLSTQGGIASHYQPST